MPKLQIEISRFVDDHFPGFVECTLVDTTGATHLFVEKVPVVTLADLGLDSTYPQPGLIACEVEALWEDGNGQMLARVSTACPFGVESTDGLSRFVVLESQLMA